MRKVFLSIASLLICLCSFSQNFTRSESRESLYLETYHNNKLISRATGFVITYNNKSYLVTCYHVLTNKDPHTLKWINKKAPLAPNRVAIFHNAQQQGKYYVKWESLFTRNKKSTPRWMNNILLVNKKPKLVDVVELPLTDISGVALYPVPVEDSVSYHYGDVEIQGFPIALGDWRLEHTSVPAEGLVNTDIALDSMPHTLMYYAEEDLVEMSGSPMRKPQTSEDDSKTFLGMYSRMPGMGSMFLNSSFIGHFLDLHTRPKPVYVRTQQYAGTFVCSTGTQTATINIHPKTATTAWLELRVKSAAGSDSVYVHGNATIIKSHGSVSVKAGSSWCKLLLTFRDEKTKLIVKAPTKKGCSLTGGLTAEGTYLRKKEGE